MNRDGDYPWRTLYKIRKYLYLPIDTSTRYKNCSLVGDTLDHFDHLYPYSYTRI